MKLTKAQRAVIYAMFDGHCAYCGIVLPEKWHADHIEPIYRITTMVKVGHSWKYKATGECNNPQNEREDNYFPACVPCNIDKSVYPLEDWRKGLERRVQVLRDNHSAYRHAERFGLVAVIETKVVFYFERHAERNKG